MPSGPLAPKKVRNAPTLDTDPSASRGPRHTWFARVTAMKIALPEASSATPFGLGIAPTSTSSCPEARNR